MPSLFQNKEIAAADASVWAFILAVASIHFSPAIASISLAMALLALLLSGSERRIQRLGLSVALLLVLLEFLGSVHHQRLLLHLPLYVAMSVHFGPLMAQRWINRFYKLWWAWVLPVIWISLASLLEFAQHPEFYRQMVMESKPMPLFSQVYHIEYSVIQAVLVLLLLKGLLTRQVENRSMAWAALVLMILGLHALSARTGILAFWVGMLGLLWPYRLSLNWKYIGFVPVVVLLLSLGTMRERLSNSWQDMQTLVQSSDPNHQSMAQRWEAWKAAWQSIQHKPLLGWGSGQVDQAMAWSYEQQTKLDAENWIGPHNQFLEMTLQGGFLVVLLGLIWSLDFMRRSSNIAWTAGLGLAMMFESLGERQAGVLMLVLVLIFVQMETNRPARHEKSVNEAGLLDL